MNSDGLTFIHATGILVDHQARGIQLDGDEHARSAVLDASRVAWQRVVEACVDHAVDFLLLGGETFAEADRSLRARVAIRDGLQILADSAIPVFVLPGTVDPVAAWQAMPGLPDNVTVFDPASDEPTAVLRHGEVVAQFQACLNATPDAEPTDWSDEPVSQSRIAPFRIGVAPPFQTDGLPPSQQQVEHWLSNCTIDYLALPRPFRRIQVAIPDRQAHCPGPAVALTETDLGCAGVSLVKVEANHAVSVGLVPISPIRRERLHIRVDHTSTLELLIQCMRQLTGDLKAVDQATVLLVDWRIRGSGDLYDSLQSSESEAELFELLSMDGSIATALHISHDLTLLPPDDIVDADAEAQTEDEAETHPMLESFTQRLDQEHSLVRTAMNRRWPSEDEQNSPWFRRLESLAARVDHSSVSELAHTHATDWFGDQTE